MANLLLLLHFLTNTRNPSKCHTKGVSLVQLQSPFPTSYKVIFDILQSSLDESTLKVRFLGGGVETCLFLLLKMAV